MVVSLTSAVSVTWHSVGTSLRAAAKSVVGNSTDREIRELLVKHNDLNTSNNKTVLTLYYSPVYIYSEELWNHKNDCIRHKNGAIVQRQ